MTSSSKASDSSSSRSKRLEDDQEKEKISRILFTISRLKKQIQASRSISIKEKLEENKRNLKGHTARLFDWASKRLVVEKEKENYLSFRLASPLCKINGWDCSKEFGEMEIFNCQEEMLSSAASLVYGNNGGGRSVVKLVKLPYVEKISPYTTWIFLDKNQRMVEDQSVVGRRRIYYDPNGSETLICSDSDEEIAEPEEEKHEFSEGEDLILWETLQEHGLSSEVLDILSQSVEATYSEIEGRYEMLMNKYQQKDENNSEASGSLMPEGRTFFDKTLSAALDSFDNLFCRRCLVFDCRLHGCSQSLIIPTEKQSYVFELEENRNPCGDHCYLKRREAVHNLCHDISDPTDVHTRDPITSTGKSGTALSSESDSNPDDHGSNLAAERMCTKMRSLLVVSSGEAETTNRVEHLGAAIDSDAVVEEVPLKVTGKRKVLKHETTSLVKPNLSVGKFLNPADKKQKILSAVSDRNCLDVGVTSSYQFHKESVDESIGNSSETNAFHSDESNSVDVEKGAKDANNPFNLRKAQSSHGWSSMEKDLYLKGVEIFGKNSCLIARNLLSGLKTCTEVSNYMFNDGATLLSRQMSTNSFMEDSGNGDHDYMEQEMPPRSRIWRRRGRGRKLKYTWKSAGHPSFRKRIADGKHQSCKQYTPCGCQQMCGKDCPCQLNGTCCEKYCGCSKSCKNRFRGCHCAKSQCRSRQCPCFAAGRECDPDVCRNCWVSCGDGSLGEPAARGDGYQCGNMNLLLKQQQRILLAKSEVAGWGAFLKNPVNKNDYLGEYTGELISHKEADKRGKIYDRANSSFLFDLNDQYVLDAYRKGDKLKFANHSSNPNCYAKVMLVAGDHRVGIFAKEHIEASEELFYDYRYGPDQAPAWARKPEGSKRDDSAVSHSRAHKVA
ncbi:uncharacterized protein A4U43_C07F16730 [Asparagus officinalis]|uniref:[histone H3]-lysine(27) N-trimethyltransferase n=1 Tax=Asparagus officinalis TaxID=4686 RepID=A0A5P1EFW4_ASPOF|nr:histone-lysine N-methyltransferase EZ3 isoform X2 [Asparagus officinalis]ONK63581.1 uncharacterized protein A4U43_C07F16730 [Asparagus officinalis]